MSTEHHDAKFDPAFFKEVNEEMESDTAGSAMRPGSSELAWPISLHEVEAAMAKLQSGKASGPDEVPPELIIKAGPQMKHALYDLFTEIWAAGRVPEDWLMAHITPIYKQSGARDDMANYRPIALTSVIAKLYETLVCARLTNYIERNKLIGDEQGGFRGLGAHILVFP